MTNKKKSANDIKDLILGVIKDNYSDPQFSVQSLADRLRISISYLRKIIGDSFGICPQELIVEYRLLKALEYFLSHKSVPRVSNKVGYNRSKSFRRIFKDKFGLSPLDLQVKIRSTNHSELALCKNKSMLNIV
jgi:AraC-like DNA-binding protein